MRTRNSGPARPGRPAGKSAAPEVWCPGSEPQFPARQRYPTPGATDAAGAPEFRLVTPRRTRLPGGRMLSGRFRGEQTTHSGQSRPGPPAALSDSATREPDGHIGSSGRIRKARFTGSRIIPRPKGEQDANVATWDAGAVLTRSPRTRVPSPCSSHSTAFRRPAAAFTAPVNELCTSPRRRRSIPSAVCAPFTLGTRPAIPFCCGGRTERDFRKWEQGRTARSAHA